MTQDASDDTCSAVEVALDRNSLLSNPALGVADMAARAGGVGFCKVLGHHIVSIADALVSARIQYDRDKLFCRSRQQKQLNSMFGTGLLTEEGSTWSQLHDSVNNTFTRNNISRYHSTIVEAIDTNIQTTGKPGQTLQVHLGHDTIGWSIGTISSVLLGQRLSNTQIGNVLEAYLDRQHHDSESSAGSQARSPFARLLKRMQRISSKVEHLLATAVHEALQQNPAERPNLLLDINSEIARESRCPFSQPQHNDLVKTLFMAGIQTSSYALDWTLILLARHAEVWQQLARDVRPRLGHSKPNLDDLEALVLVQQVIKEVLRMRPVIHTIQKGISQPCQLAGLEVHPGDTLNLSLFGIHNSNSYWADPEVFRPERFASEIKPQSFTPFGLGQHTCIGQHLAMHVLSTTLIRLVQQFDIVADASLSMETESTFLLKPATDQIVSLQPIVARP